MFIKKITSLILLVITLLTAVTSVCAQENEIPQELVSYGQEIYSGARSYFGRRSFSGYCGTYVRCQLRAMGIFDGEFDFRGNGNQWYSNFEDVQRTSGGYYVYREPHLILSTINSLVFSEQDLVSLGPSLSI